MAGGMTSTSTPSGRSSTIWRTRLSAMLREPCIFQLPATSFLRMVCFRSVPGGGRIAAAPPAAKAATPHKGRRTRRSPRVSHNPRIDLPRPAFDDPRMRTLRIFLTALLLTVSVAAFAQAQDDDPGKQIGDLRAQLDQIEKGMKDDNITDKVIDDLRGQAGDVVTKSQKVSSALSPNRDAAKAS